MFICFLGVRPLVALAEVMSTATEILTEGIMRFHCFIKVIYGTFATNGSYLGNSASQPLKIKDSICIHRCILTVKE